MSYFDDFKTLSQMYGDNSSEQRLSAMQHAFNEYFAQSPNKVTANIDGVDESIIVQHMKYGENFNDEKLIVVLNSTICKIGSKISWGGEIWIVLNYENRAITTHKTFKIGKANNSLKWVNNTGQIITEPCIIQEMGLGFQDSSRQVSEVDSSRKIVIQFNQNTNQIAEDYRFIIGKKQVYAVTDIDDFTNQDEIITLRVEKTQRLDTDDFINGIADNGSTQFTPTPTNNIQFSTNELKVAQNYTSTISVSEVGIPSTTFTFTISGVPLSSYEIVSSTGNSITIKCKEYYYEGVLKATSSADTLKFAEVPLILKGLF